MYNFFCIHFGLHLYYCSKFRKLPKSIDSELKKMARKIAKKDAVNKSTSNNVPMVLDADHNDQEETNVSGKTKFIFVPYK